MRKALQTLLKENNYLARGDSEKRKLRDICNIYIAEQKSMWYYDLSEDINKHLHELYNDNKILRNIHYRYISEDAVNWYIRDSAPKEREERLQEGKKPFLYMTNEEIAKEILDSIVDRELERKSKTLLKSLRESGVLSFNINNFYGILREYHNLSPKDKLEVSPPVYLFNLGNLDKNLKKGASFEDKRYPKQRKNKFEGYIEEIKEDDFNLKDRAYRNDKSFQEFFAREYLWTLSNIPIAYKDPKKAIEFFENETGVNLNRPKEYKKFVF